MQTADLNKQEAHLLAVLSGKRFLQMEGHDCRQPSDRRRYDALSDRFRPTLSDSPRQAREIDRISKIRKETLPPGYRPETQQEGSRT